MYTDPTKPQGELPNYILIEEKGKKSEMNLSYENKTSFSTMHWTFFYVTLNRKSI